MVVREKRGYLSRALSSASQEYKGNQPIQCDDIRSSPRGGLVPADARLIDVISSCWRREPGQVDKSGTSGQRENGRACCGGFGALHGHAIQGAEEGG
jgi:hypothetical protein